MLNALAKDLGIPAGCLEGPVTPGGIYFRYPGVMNTVEFSGVLYLGADYDASYPKRRRAPRPRIQMRDRQDRKLKRLGLLGHRITFWAVDDPMACSLPVDGE